MHIHEYQAKDLFKKNGIKVPNFIVVSNANKTKAACEKLGGSIWVSEGGFLLGTAVYIYI